MTWVLLTLVYGLLKGVREVIKKKALEKSTVMEVLFCYTLFSFLLVVPTAPRAGDVPAYVQWAILVKSVFIFLAWMASFYAIRELPISYFGVLDLSRVLFATLLGVIILNENLTPIHMIGIGFVVLGLVMLKSKRAAEKEHVKLKFVLLALGSCVLNALSGLMDKLLTKVITPTALQFWYMLYLVLLYLVYIIVAKKKINWKAAVKNYWIWILSILFAVADKALFIANSYEDSRLTVMTLIKQSGCIVTILAGKFVFKEESIHYKLLCAIIIIIGIVFGVIS